MEIVTSSNVLTITGNIKSVGDYQSIKSSLDVVKGSNNSIIVELKDSISITSSVIRCFNTLVLKDKRHVQMKVGNSKLMELLNDLNLTKTFNAIKV